jgi:hypothetical protein
MARGTHLPHGSSLLSMAYVRKTSATVVCLYFLTDDSSTWWVKGTKTKPLVISIPRLLKKHRPFFLSCVPADRVCNVGILKYVLLSRSVTTVVFFGWHICQFNYCYTLPKWFSMIALMISRSQWLRGLRRRSAASRLHGLWVRIPPGVWMFICCECCVLSSRGLCDELITRPQESYQLCGVSFVI